MPVAYSNDGVSSRSVPVGYTAAAGEVVFADYQDPTTDVGAAALTVAFPNFASAYAALQRKTLVRAATQALSKSDLTIIRCASAGVAVPSEWQTYRAALRAISNGSDTTSQALPATPAYPAGT